MWGKAHFITSMVLVGITVGLRVVDQRPASVKIVQTGPVEWAWDFSGTGSKVASPGGFAVSWLALGASIPLNYADAKTLMSVPGIGPAKANSIVQNRRLQGHFERMSDLDRVRGFGPKTVISVAPYFHVGTLSEVSHRMGSPG